MTFEPSSPSTDIPNTDPFESVAYSDIVEGSICYEKEVITIIYNELYLCNFPLFYRWNQDLAINGILFPLMLSSKDTSALSIDIHQKRTFNFKMN